MRFGSILALSGIALCASGAAHAADTNFNLECSGTKTIKTLYSDESENYALVYRVSLDDGRWCEGECGIINTIAQVQPTFVILQLSADSPSHTLYNRINRVTGAHEIGKTDKGPRGPETTVVWSWRGRCEKAAFTGFPSFETKF